MSFRWKCAMIIDSSGKRTSCGLLIVLWSALLCIGCGSSPKETMEALAQQVRTGESDRIVITEALVQDNLSDNQKKEINQLLSRIKEDGS